MHSYESLISYKCDTHMITLFHDEEKQPDEQAGNELMLM